jgi:hypothetical protein
MPDLHNPHTGVVGGVRRDGPDIVTIHDDDHAVRDDQLALLAGRYASVAFTPRRWRQTRG